MTPKKKIAILTINDYSNYGNRLQNYALQETVRAMESEVETLVYDRNLVSVPIHSKFKKLFNLKNWGGIKRRILLNLNKRIYQEKILNFKNFTNKYISESDFKINDLYVPVKLSEDYDFFITGSDQVWNPFFKFGTEIDFLTFAPTHKRISYAPSFGVSNLSTQETINYKEKLKGFEKISVREDAGAVIIKNITGKEVPVLVDPTLLLKKEEWLKISYPDVDKPMENYLLTYFLGEISEETQKNIDDIANEYRLKVINLGSLKDRVRYSVGPSEFLDYLNSASLIFTDSFHGCVFSIVFEKPFIVFERYIKNETSMNSRIDTLLSKLNLKERKWSAIVNRKDLFYIEYAPIKEILDKEREKSYNFLKKTMSL
ncbi:polysaccharide pyruvyl transferase family protein [Exiguobacterium sp. SH1S21]|nr:polysaccharide pyruvyl transferase family protein [Exiguobacterium sp. SH1S21]